MWLTGPTEGAPMLAPGRPGPYVAQALAHVARRAGTRSPTTSLLAERAAYYGFTRRAPLSCGGSTRVLETTDGLLALTLARSEDVEVLGLLTGGGVRNAWDRARAWAGRTEAAAAEADLRELGLPGGAVGRERHHSRPGVVSLLSAPRRAEPGRRPLVIDLTSLWAGPLCAHLLTLTGAKVLTVESPGRPDGTRNGSPEFHRMLHEGHEHHWLDFPRSPEDLFELRSLIARADLVLESSRARALRRLGIDAETVVRAGTSWLSITACGRADDSVGFGDDIAARAGLLRELDGAWFPVGDALADPLTGVVAAAAALDALAGPSAQLLDVSMIDVAREAAGDCSIPDHEVVQLHGDWFVEDNEGVHLVRQPHRR